MSTHIGKVIGTNARQIRGGESQVSVAARMSTYLGSVVPRQTVWAMERGERDFRAAELIALAAALGTSVPELLRSEDDVALGDSAGVEWGDYRQLVSGVNVSADGWVVYQIARDLEDERWRLGEIYRSLIGTVRHAVEDDDALRARVEADLANARQRLADAWQHYYDTHTHERDFAESFSEWSKYKHSALPDTTPAIIAGEDALFGTAERMAIKGKRVKRTVRGERSSVTPVTDVTDSEEKREANE